MSSFDMNEQQLQFLIDFTKVRTGISLEQSKASMIKSRTTKLIRRYEMAGYDEFCLALDRNNPQLVDEFITAITTNMTSFFREKHHFEYLTQHLPELFLKHNSLRLWSAGCSSGQEPYSIAMTIEKVLQLHANRDYQILATDINQEMLAIARLGEYSLNEVSEVICQEEISAWFLKGSGVNAGKCKVKPGIREKIDFDIVNLTEPLHVDGGFNIVFCRNVMIYFDRDFQQRLLSKFYKLMTPDALLFTGHSDFAPSEHPGFKQIGKTMYQLVPGYE